MNATFTIFVLATALPVIGRFMQRTAIGWYVWETTQSPSWLGAVAFVELLPTVALGPFSGYLADRFSRQRVIVASQLLALLVSAALALLAVQGPISPPAILALSLALGTSFAAFLPARSAFVRNIVGLGDLAKAVSIISVVGNVAVAVGPLLAGGIIAAWSIDIVFVASAMATIPALLTIPWLRVINEDKRLTGQNVLKDTRSGLRYAATHPTIGTMLAALAIASLGGRAALDLLPGFAASVLQSGPIGLAWLVSASGVGAILGGFWVGQRGLRLNLEAVVILNLLLTGIGLLVFSLGLTYALSLICILAVGISLGVNSVGCQTVIQIAAEGSYSGRVLGLYGMLHRGAAGLGSLIMGCTSSFLGLQASVAIGALFCALSWVLLRWRRKLADLAA
ncbi:MAG TPA: MFS transporter [Stellaceae bacterium]|nr:MFS transporter [Stellaceae bacterium]